MSSSTLSGIRHLSPAGLARILARRVWSSSRALGLRADLEALPEPRAAKVPVRMEATDSTSYRGFERELEQVGDDDAVEVIGRIRFCRGGVSTLYVATGDDGQPIYAQWLVRPADQHLLEAVTRGLFPPLGEGEVLIEGAYTFVDGRGQGAMADGMHQLLRVARDERARAAITYVTDDNIPSLKGCARVGFGLDHVRMTTRRFGIRKSIRRPVDEDARAAWQRATG